MASRGQSKKPGKASGLNSSSRRLAGVLRLNPRRLAKLRRDGLKRLEAIRESLEILSEAAILSDDENNEMKQLAVEIEQALNFAFTQSH
jgi:hypothetical protein